MGKGCRRWPATPGRARSPSSSFSAARTRATRGRAFSPGTAAPSTTSTRTRTRAITPDGRYVLYSSDLTDYSNMYLVPVGDFETLPLLEADTPARPDML